MTSIGFGRGEAIVVGLPIREVADLMQRGIRRREFIDFESEGERLIVNPLQFKVLQSAEPPEEGADRG